MFQKKVYGQYLLFTSAKYLSKVFVLLFLGILVLHFFKLFFKTRACKAPCLSFIAKCLIYRFGTVLKWYF